jgi:general secretion pathway protein I
MNLQPRVHTRTQRGFTLLEAVIAIAIFAMGATALFGWVNTNLITLNRVDQINQRVSAVESAVEFMSRIDPITQPSGKAQLGQLVIEWETHPAEYRSDVLDEQNQRTINEASLHRASVSVYRDQHLLNNFELTLLGMRQVRDMSDVIFN